MIFADKLMELRKKSGWSQEELAQQMGVSRQSVSKWEGAQSIPDMNKLLKLSELFGVSLDYLLKDEMQEPGAPQPRQEPETEFRHVSLEESQAFLDVKRRTAPSIALGTALCILSPVPVMLLGVCSEVGIAGITENMAGGLGMIALLLMVALAVTLFLLAGSKTGRYEFLEKELIETAYGVTGMVKEEQEKYRDTYVRCNIIGAVLCICALVPVMVGAILLENSDVWMVAMISLMMAMVAAGVYLFVTVGIRWASYEKLLQEGDYSVKKKQGSKVPGIVSGCYWVVAVAVYLLLSRGGRDWGLTGTFWPVAALLYVPVYLLTKYFAEKK